MPGGDSFDPRSWGKPAEDKPQLPEAWRDVAGGSAPPPDIAVAAAGGPPTSSPGASGPIWLPSLISAGILCAGCGAAWITRTKPDIPAGQPASVTADLAQQKVEPTGPVTRSLVLASIGDLSGALGSAGIDPHDTADINAATIQAMRGVTGEIRAMLSMVEQPGGGMRLVRLEASLADGSGVVVSPDAAGKYVASPVAAQLSKKITIVSGELDSDSFYSSAVAAGVTDSLIPEFVNAFAFDFNLASEVSPGDTFEVAYEQSVNARGEPVGQPELLYASLVTAAKRKALYRYKPVDQEVGWFDGNGTSAIRSLMQTPVDGARISSKFGWRFHPVLHYNKLHKGTDFAAPIGTPIYAAANATVEWAAMKGANGNLTILRHENGWQTYYLHQSMFMPGITPGAHVIQRQKIGEIGTTGRSTGPHLHYELHIDGEAVDPQSIQTEAGRKALAGADLAAFIQQRDRVDVARARQAQ